MNTPDVTYRVYAQRGAQQITIKEGFKTYYEAQHYIDYECIRYIDGDKPWRIGIAEEKSQKLIYYEFIDSVLENARRELSSEDMVGLINDLGVILDMHFDGIRREVEGEYDEE